MAMFDALLKRKQEATKRGFLYAGIVAAAIYNANPFRGAGAKLVNPLDFVPDYDRKPAPAQTREQQLAIMRSIGEAWKKRQNGAFLVAKP